MYFKQWNRILSVICAAALSMSCRYTHQSGQQLHL